MSEVKASIDLITKRDRLAFFKLLTSVQNAHNRFCLGNAVLMAREKGPERGVSYLAHDDEQRVWSFRLHRSHGVTMAPAPDFADTRLINVSDYQDQTGDIDERDGTVSVLDPDRDVGVTVLRQLPASRTYWHWLPCEYDERVEKVAKTYDCTIDTVFNPAGSGLGVVLYCQKGRLSKSARTHMQAIFEEVAYD